MAPPLFPRLLHGLGQLQRSRAARTFERAAASPEQAQRGYLAALLRANADTAYGRAHGFGEIRSAEAYADRVPLVTYDEVAPWVARTMRGERGLLTHDAPIFYGLSTGTTGGVKHIPVTATYRREFQRTVQVAMWHVCRAFPEAFRGRVLYAVVARQQRVSEDGLDVGAMSGFNFTEQPPVVRGLYAWPAELFTIADPDARTYVALYLALIGEVSLITGVFPLAIVNMLRMLETHAEVLAHDLARGTLSGAPGLTPEERTRFMRGLVPRPDLARRLARLASLPVEAYVAQAFPHLRLAYCWTTSTAGAYIPELTRRLGPGVAVRDGIFAATEAWCNIPMGAETPGGPAAVDCLYMEFIEEGAYAAGSRATLPLWALEQGKRYVLVTSNATGLYRYMLGDVVEVRGMHGNTPCFHFVRKVGAWSNLAGELLDETHVNVAVAGALAELGLEATWFALVGDARRRGYTLHLEPAPSVGALSDERRAALAACVDARLTAGAWGYGDGRSQGELVPIEAVQVQQGCWAAWRTRRAASGTGEAQLKPQHLLPDPSQLPPEFRA
jgi:hypothetical protein